MAPTDIVCVICAAQGEEDCVLCDECREPYHPSCVGEDESVRSREWFCSKCIANTQEEPTQPTTSSPTAAPSARRAPTHQPDMMHEISQLFDQMKACMEMTNESPRTPQVRKRCYACCCTDTKGGILCQQCDRWCHVSCLSEDETASIATWKCVFCTVASMKASANPIDRFLNRLETLERKMEASAMAPRPSYGVPPPCSTVLGRSAETSHELSQSQASARHTGAAKLPTFSGNPEEWDMFISAYEETTRLCGFTDGENIIRLQQALKGRALKSVQLRLRKAENLEEVLESLRSSYGRPELIVNTLLDQIKNSPVPKMDKLDTLVNYALMVEEISAAVRTGGLENRYDGPLLEELVSRLPPIIAFLWGMQRLGKPLASLSDFGAWMKSAKEAALIASPSAAKADERRYARNVNVHAPIERTAQAEPVKCACDQQCNQLEYCEAFLLLSPNDRWKLIKGDQLCSICLRRHRSTCRVTRPCGKNGCTKRHHPLLHSPSLTEGRGENRYESNLSHSTGIYSARDVLLRYIPVTIHGPKRAVNTVALLDEGSSVTLMERRLLEELGLQGESKPLCLSWTGGQNREENDSVETSITLSGTKKGSRRFEINAVRTVRSLGLPAQSVDGPEKMNGPCTFCTTTLSRQVPGTRQHYYGVPRP
uniref:PHD-type domain-containing protein n=1 Tax=Anopheles epiroticus TaxID=199890 RepID=A0A182PWK7_9DIPT